MQLRALCKPLCHRARKNLSRGGTPSFASTTVTAAKINSRIKSVAAVLQVFERRWIRQQVDSVPMVRDRIAANNVLFEAPLEFDFEACAPISTGRGPRA
jgi:hypothetical protein